MDYSRLLSALRRWWFIVLACVLVGLLASLAYNQFTPAKYTARADVMIVVSGESASDLSSGSTFASQQARNLSVLADRARIVDPVIRRLNLPDTASQISSSISATVPANTSIVTLEVTYTSAETSLKIVNALADSLAANASDLLPPVKNNGAKVSLRPVYEEVVPQHSSSPSIATALALGLGGGLLAGLALALLFDAIRQRSPAAPVVRTEFAQPVRP